MTTAEGLPPGLVAVLRFEARHESINDDTRTVLVRQAFGLSLVRYRQRLIRAVETPGADLVEPALVARLRTVLADGRRRHTVAHSNATAATSTEPRSNRP